MKRNERKERDELVQRMLLLADIAIEAMEGDKSLNIEESTHFANQCALFAMSLIKPYNIDVEADLTEYVFTIVDEPGSAERVITGRDDLAAQP